MILSPTVTDLDYQSLINWDDSLTHGLMYWHLNLPGRWGGTRAYDLVTGRIATRINMASPATSTSGQGTTTRPGGWGEERLDGANDYLDLGTTLNFPALTYSFWIAPVTLANAYQSMVDRAGGGMHTQAFLLNTGKLAVYFRATGDVMYDGTGVHTLSVNVWRHILISYSEVFGLNAYVDGIIDATASPNGPLDTTILPTFVGASPEVGSRECAARMDSICVWKRRLDANECRAVYLDSRTFHPRMLRRVGVPMGKATGGFAQSLGGTLASSGAMPRAINKALVGAV